MSFEIAKAGWMHRLSSVLRRWKKNWVVLYKDGNLKYFESPDSHVAEECIRLKVDCIRIENSTAVTDSDAPEGRNRNSMLALQLRDRRVVFCAESPDDMSAWQISLEQARVINAAQRVVPGQNPPAYAPHYGTHPPAYVVGQPACNCYRSVTVPNGAQVNHVVINPDGTQTNVVYVRDRGCCHRHYGSDMATGMLAGAAIGTMMWGPLLWW